MNMRLTGLVSKNAFRTSIKEGAEDAIVKKIDKMTDSNDHTGAVVELAKFLGNKQFITIATAIQTIHDADKGMHPGLFKYREEIRDRILNGIEQKKGKNVRRAFEQAF